MKFCKRCGFERPIEDFPVAPRSNGGYRFLCKEHWREYCREQSILHTKRYPEYWKQRYLKNKEAHKKRARESFYRKRIACLKFYGGDPPKCDCCGENKLEFLAIDHINGGGTKHKKQLQEKGSNLYRWLMESNFPEGFRVLCHNCNMSFGFYGYCPHNKRELIK